jgi:hypothetical protein
MPSRALTAAEVAKEFGRSKSWLHENWRQLVAKRIIPPPLIEEGHPTWSKAQLWAYLDKPLPTEFQSLIAAHRAALDAAAAPIDRDASDVQGEAGEKALPHSIVNRRECT